MPITIRAELTGSSICATSGITAVGFAPVLDLCGRLLQAGHDPATRLEAYRGPMLALTVRSIGEGANLEIVDNQFRPARARGAVLASCT